MSQHEIRAIEKAITSLIDVIDRQTREIRTAVSAVEQLPELVRDTQRATQEALSDLQIVQVQLQIADARATAEGVSTQLTAEQEALDRKVSELQEDLERTAERYRARLGEVDTQVEGQIRALDEPVLRILEQLYPRLISAPYSEVLLPGRRAQQIASEDHALMRSEVLSTRLTDLSERLADMRDRLAEILLVADAEREDVFLPVGVVVRASDVDAILRPGVSDSGRERIRELVSKRRADTETWSKRGTPVPEGLAGALARIAESDDSERAAAATRCLAHLEENGVTLAVDAP